MDILTIVEAAAELGLSPRTLRGQAKRGTLAATQAGRMWLVTREELERYRREHLGRFKGSNIYHLPIVKQRTLTPHQRPTGDWKVNATIAGQRRSFYGSTSEEALNNAHAARAAAAQEPK